MNLLLTHIKILINIRTLTADIFVQSACDSFKFILPKLFHYYSIRFHISNK